ncbi:MAG: type II toxin-antitoxin system PemK/MazF family toxin [Pirellulales bacterium]|jgi:mRNA interferase MazF
MAEPARGEIWLTGFDPVLGHEQAGKRPALIVSADLFNNSPAGLVIVLPITSQRKGVRSHVAIAAPEGGVKKSSYIKCEDVRSVAKQRLTRRWGAVSDDTMRAVEDRLRILLEL